VIESPKSEKYSEYDLKLMTIDQERLEIPEDMEYSATVHMSSLEFQRVCRDLSALGEEITIEVVKGTVRFSANGEMGSGSIQLRQNTAVDKEEDATIIQMNEPVKSTFSLKYCSNFSKTASLSDRLEFSLTSQIPSLFEYKIDEVGYVRYFLAPKIDEEEMVD